MPNRFENQPTNINLPENNRAEALDKMDQIDLERYYEEKKSNIEWLKILKEFPSSLQREIIDERRAGTAEDIEEFKKFKLDHDQPQTVEVKSIINENLESLANTPQTILDEINKKYGTNLKTNIVFDAHPERYLEYAARPAKTAKPIILLNKSVYFGMGRFIAALLRGDKTLDVWELKEK